MARKVVKFDINGSSRETAIREYDVLLDVIRENLNLTGTKRGCDMGTCGCCTVLIDGQARLSCLTMALQPQVPMSQPRIIIARELFSKR